MTTLQYFNETIHSCRITPTTQKNRDLRNILDKTVIPRLESYCIFLEQIQNLEEDHSLRSDAIVIEIVEDCFQLTESAERAERHLA